MSHHGSVLIVDDEPHMRTFLVRCLLLAGLRPEPAACAEEALERLAKPGIALVVIDLNLGEDTGSDLLARIRGLYPDLPAVFCSGYPDMGTEYPDVPFILKTPGNDSQFRREVVGVVKRELRNRCRDIQASETHTATREIQVMLTGHLAECARDQARLARIESALPTMVLATETVGRRSLGEMLASYGRDPLVWGMVVLLGLGGAAFVHDWAERGEAIRALQKRVP